MRQPISLEEAVAAFAGLVARLPDHDLARTWDWKGYEEGVRFAFFRTYEDLRDLAVSLSGLRRAAGCPQSSAQHALAQYHQAYRELQAVLLGLEAEDARRAPAEGEWAVQRTVAHMIGADRGFFFVVQKNLQAARRGETGRPEASEAIWEQFWEGDPYAGMPDDAPLSDLVAYHSRLHRRVLDELSGIADAEMGLPSYYWEDEPFPLSYRLHRFDSHLRQHTVQVEKALEALGLGPGEARRLLRLIYAALGEAEGQVLGAADLGAAACLAAAGAIHQRAGSVAAARSGAPSSGGPP
jgi:hypothetical protein